MKRRSHIIPPQIYEKTYLPLFDSQDWKEVAKDKVITSSTKILYYASVIGIIKLGEQFVGVIINTKSGFAQVRGKVLIDTTGEAELIFRAGLLYTKGADERVQNSMMIFGLGGRH